MNILDYFNIDISNPSLPDIVVFSISLFLLSSVSVLSFINIVITLSIWTFSEKELVLNWLKDKTFLIKLVNFYKKVSIITLSYEILLFFIVNYYILYFCFKIINHHFKFF